LSAVHLLFQESETLKLYHFTRANNLRNDVPENILAVGLKPFPNELQHLLTPPVPPTVWLTANPDQADMFNEPREIRITVVIMSSDPHLVQWNPYLRKHLGPEKFHATLQRIADKPNGPALVKNTWDYWAYFGAVTLDRIEIIERADPADPARWEDLKR
jgi:hypothetical protein